MTYESEEAYHYAMQAQAEQEAEAESEAAYHDWCELSIKRFTDNGDFAGYTEFIVEQFILPLIKSNDDRQRVLGYIKPKVLKPDELKKEREALKEDLDDLPF